jgi:hypothetical protein
MDDKKLRTANSYNSLSSSGRRSSVDSTRSLSRVSTRNKLSRLIGSKKRRPSATQRDLSLSQSLTGDPSSPIDPKDLNLVDSGDDDNLVTLEDDDM